MTGHAATALTPHRGSSSAAPLYDLRLNPPYLVDYTSALSGKRVAATKRRVRFRFGFSDAEALASGATGIDCRGCEHDVTLIWSHTSGKRLVVADGREVHFSVGKPTQGKFQFTWSMRGEHVLKLIAHAAPPLQAKPGWKQFDLQLDGMSVFDMPKIFELGIKAGGDSSAVVRRQQRQPQPQQQAYNNYSLPREEEMAWARSVERHETSRSIDRIPSDPNVSSPPREQLEAPPSPRSVPEVLAVPEAPPAPVPSDLVSDPTPATEAQDLMSSPVAVLDQAPSAQVHQLYPPEPQQQVDQFAPQPAPAPAYEDVASSIMSGYGQQVPPQQQQDLPVLPPSTTYEQPPQQQYYPQQAPIPAQTQTYYAPEQPTQQQYAQPPAQQYNTPEQPTQQQYYEQQQFAQPPTQSYEQPPNVVAPASGHDLQSPMTANTATFTYTQPSSAPLPAETPNKENYDVRFPAIVPPENSPRGVDAVNAIDDVDDTNDKNVDDLGRAMKNLVNLEDISARPEESLENMRAALKANPFAEKNVPQQKKDKMKGTPKSRGIAPVGQGWALSGKSLAEVHAVTASHKPSQPTKEVMKMHAFDPAAGQAGMMVVYGQQQGGAYGPPALERASGFGVGARMPGGGYGSYRQ